MLWAVSSSPRFTFVRHGQCVANAQGRVVGQLDSPLTPLGHTQAEGVAILLSGRRDLTAVFTVDLIPVIFRRIMARGNHDTRKSSEMPHGIGKHRNRS